MGRRDPRADRRREEDGRARHATAQRECMNPTCERFKQPVRSTRTACAVCGQGVYPIKGDGQG